MSDNTKLNARYDNGWYYCWLIEWRDGPPPQWLGAYTWETDANKAIWYARKSDADAVWNHDLKGTSKAVVCEHGFQLEKFYSALTAQEQVADETITPGEYEEVLADHRRLVRELDVLLNGDGAAKQASLCDIVAQVASTRFKLVRADMPISKVLTELQAEESARIRARSRITCISAECAQGAIAALSSSCSAGWVPWKPGDDGPARGWYWTTQDDGVATVCERRANGWRSAAWKVVAYWSSPMPPPYTATKGDA